MTAAADIETLLKQGKNGLREGRPDRAAEFFQRAVELDPDRVEAHEGLATAAFLQQDYPQAVEHFTRVTRLAPAQANGYVNLGAVYNRMGEYGQAIEVLRRGLQKNSRLSEGFYNLGLAYRGQKQLSMAVSAYREAIRLAPHMAEAYLNLANAYAEMGSHQQAIMQYKKALDVRPGFPQAVRGLARAEHAARESRRAISPFGRLVGDLPAGGQQSAAAGRPMTDEDRLADRRTLGRLARESETCARDLLHDLRHNFEKCLQALDRGVIHEATAPWALEEAYEAFRPAFRRLRELRSNLKEKMQQVREHEEAIKREGNRPD